MLMILPIITLLSLIEATGTVSCAENVILRIAEEISDALNEGIDTSEMQESLQCVAVEGKWIRLYISVYIKPTRVSHAYTRSYVFKLALSLLEMVANSSQLYGYLIVIWMGSIINIQTRLISHLISI